MITVTSLTHPTMMTKIIKAAKKAEQQGYAEYVKNRRGKTIIRVGFHDGKLMIFCGFGENITRKVAAAFTRFKENWSK